MSNRDSMGFGDLLPQDVVDIFAHEKHGKRPGKKRSHSLGRALGWLKGKKRKDLGGKGKSPGLGPALDLALDGHPAGHQGGHKGGHKGRQAQPQGNATGCSTAILSALLFYNNLRSGCLTTSSKQFSWGKS